MTERTTEQRITMALLAIRKLDHDSSSVIRARFGLSASGHMMSLTEIGRVKGVGRHKVRQIEKEALRKLVEAFEKDA